MLYPPEKKHGDEEISGKRNPPKYESEVYLVDLDYSALVNFSLLIQNLSKYVPSQFPLWFITWYLEKINRVPLWCIPLLPLPSLYRNLGVIPG